VPGWLVRLQVYSRRGSPSLCTEVAFNRISCAALHPMQMLTPNRAAQMPGSHTPEWGCVPLEKTPCKNLPRRETWECLKGSFVSSMGTSVLRKWTLQVLHCRHPHRDQMVALVRVLPDPLRTAQSSACMFAWMLSQKSKEHERAWMTDLVQVVPVAFLDAWPRAA
jgi:hypothetical protein